MTEIIPATLLARESGGPSGVNPQHLFQAPRAADGPQPSRASATNTATATNTSTSTPPTVAAVSIPAPAPAPPSQRAGRGHVVPGRAGRGPLPGRSDGAWRGRPPGASS